MKKVWIYTLTDPHTLQVKYIGKTFRPHRRFFDHLKCVGNAKKDSWIKSLLKLSITPIFEILEETDSNNCNFLEQYWISQFKTWGFDLKNMTNGGDGTYGLIPWNKGLKGVFKHSEESKKKMSLSRKGKYMGIESSQYGRKASPETKAKQLLKKLGSKRTEEQKVKNRGANNSRSQKIYCYDSNMFLVNEYESLRDTGKDGFDWNMVSKVCRGIHKTHKNHYFTRIKI